MATISRDSREARRRRILDTGSARLALITGRIRTLPQLESHHSCPPSIAADRHDRQNHLSDLSSVAVSGEDGKHSSSLLLQHDVGSEFCQLNASDSQSTTSDSSGGLAREVDGREKDSLTSSMAQSSFFPASNRQQPSQQHILICKEFSPNQINFAIAASENTRIYCSLAAGILVVLSYVGFPIVGSGIIKRSLVWRPLYLLLVTNISIVLAQLLLEKQRGHESSEQQANTVPSGGGFGLAGHVSKALDLALMLQNIMSAAFMDCSVYTIAIVCGLSLAQKLSW